LTETLETNLVLIMRTEDYYRCAKITIPQKVSETFFNDYYWQLSHLQSNRMLGTPFSAKEKQQLDLSEVSLVCSCG